MLKNEANSRKALWVHEYYHTAVGFCSRAIGKSMGEFVEVALDEYITKQAELKPLKPALDKIREALREMGSVSESLNRGESPE